MINIQSIFTVITEHKSNLFRFSLVTSWLQGLTYPKNFCLSNLNKFFPNADCSQASVYQDFWCIILTLADNELSQCGPSSLPVLTYHQNYHKTSYIRHTLVANKIGDHLDIACRRCSNYIFILNLIPGLIGMSKDNCKARQEMFKVLDTVHLILEIWQ